MQAMVIVFVLSGVVGSFITLVGVAKELFKTNGLPQINRRIMEGLILIVSSIAGFYLSGGFEITKN